MKVIDSSDKTMGRELPLTHYFITKLELGQNQLIVKNKEVFVKFYQTDRITTYGMYKPISRYIIL